MQTDLLSGIIIYMQHRPFRSVHQAFPHQPHQAIQAILSYPQQISHPLYLQYTRFAQEATIHTVSKTFAGFWVPQSSEKRKVLEIPPSFTNASQHST